MKWSLEEFMEKAMEPLKEFMLKQTYDSDLNFAGLANTDLYVNARELPNSVIITAFVTSELKHALQ